MGKFLNKMERKFGRYAIRDLTKYLIAGYVIGLIVQYVASDMMEYLTLDPYMILHGQVWRLFTWILYPSSSNLFFYIIMLFFYYSIGTTLEHTWGAFRYNVFMIGGFLFSIIGAFVLYIVCMLAQPQGLDGYWFANSAAYGYYISYFFSAYYINLSLFLAFAISYPDMRVMLYFVIPIKVKWLAYVDVALLSVDLLFGSWVSRVAIIASLLNVLIFWLATRNYYRISPGEIKRKREFRRQVNSAPAYGGGMHGMTRHKCAICGRTEADNPNLTFRYCTKCAGNYEYCEDHLFTHEHK
ncbi:MAG: hypothetical protein E7269_07395 [Lachnospiraceae bacterium]|nr:hypothetical protein [Lachnospiraceae bacterium]